MVLEEEQRERERVRDAITTYPTEHQDSDEKWSRFKMR